ncbi:MAG TPA: ATP-binding protein [Candidatus Limnocylindrales bacterium]|nr:ATP-binding protein [Candidatus Limnocylindrales bacterium]
MAVSRKADTDQGDAIPFTVVSVRRSLRAFRRFLVVGAIAFVAVPIALIAVFEDTPLQFLPLALTIGGLIWLRFEYLKLEGQLRRARVRALDAIDLERIRIQRDLHDSAQQRLVSVRIHLGLLAQRASDADDRAAIEQLGNDLDAALAEIRNVTRDGSPELLLRNGIVESIRSAAAHAPLKVTVEARNVGRYAPSVERGVYFCCLEALQNAVKHAGPAAAVHIRLVGEPHRIAFSVDDSGVGFDPSRVQDGVGLVHLADRVDVMGGNLTIDSYPGMGTRIHGEIPVATAHGDVSVAAIQAG